MFDLWFFEFVRRTLDFFTVSQFKYKRWGEGREGGKAIKWQPYEQASQILQDYVVDKYPVYFGLKMHFCKCNKIFFEY